METKELKIQIPDGYEIDKEKSTFEKIVFKKKEDTKPKSWKEYYEQQIANKKHGYYIDDEDCSLVSVVWNELADVNKWKNVLPSEELAEAFLAMMQLISLRQAWIGNWEPDWNDETRVKWNIICLQNQVCLCDTIIKSRVLSFPTKEMAGDFMDCFRVLLEIAKPLI